MVLFSRLTVAGCMAMAATALGALPMTLSECREKAANGDAEAIWQMGQRYEKGDGVRKDNLKAVSQYRKAAENGHAEACGRLAELYETGKIVGKDPVKAARYRAMANGESGELAAAKAETELGKAKIDHIEVALDYIIGRNGQPRDVKKGIQLLHGIAKDNPTAQRVFVRRWEKGDLDEGLKALSDDEWQLVLPWFRNAYEKGSKAAGQILGVGEYRKARACKEGGREARTHYVQAIHYWSQSNLARCWYFVGQFYDPLVNGANNEISGPEAMKDETKAIKAYENCIKLNERHADARWRLGFLYQAAKRKENLNPEKALEQFKQLLRSKPGEPDYNFMYGWTGYFMIEDYFKANHGKRLEYLADQIRCNETYVSNHEGMTVSGARGELLAQRYRNLQSQRREYDDLMDQKTRRQKPYLDCIRKAARLGSKEAQKFLEKTQDQ